MRIIAVTISVALLVTSFVAQSPARTAAGDAPKAEAPVKPLVEPKVHQGDDWAVVAPADWQSFQPLPPRVVLYLIGDGREGIPLFDGTLGVLKTGIQLEVFPNPAKQALKDHVAKDVKELKESGAFVSIEEPVLADVKLPDGTPATRLDAEFVRKQNGRVSIQTKLYCADAQGRHVVASGFITCRREGRLSVKATGLPEWLRAHVASLVLDPTKAGADALKPAYEKYEWNAAAAIALAGQANDLVNRERFPEAAAGFREAIKAFPAIPAAQNGLAWALLSAKNAKPADLKEALTSATEAVRLTEELDTSALDTLAWAQHRNGDKATAVKTINKALKLEPGRPELVERLKSIE